MKTLFSTLILLCSLVAGCSQTLKPIPLSAPDMTREATMMQAFAQRKSTREFSPWMLSKQDLSDLLWAANGINRPESGKRTAPSAMNRQDIDLYVCLEKGAYFFDYKQNMLVPVTDQDLRTMKDAPVVLGRDGCGDRLPTPLAVLCRSRVGYRAPHFDGRSGTGPGVGIA